MIEITSEYLASQGLSENFPKRFWSKVNKTESCWFWMAATIAGYGVIGRGFPKRGHILAHVSSWVLHHGPVPDHFKVLHKCDNPKCVRPDHLWLGTQAQNIKDRQRKGRQFKKLEWSDVLRIRHDYSLGTITQRALAKQFSVRQNAIRWALYFRVQS